MKNSLKNENLICGFFQNTQKFCKIVQKTYITFYQDNSALLYFNNILVSLMSREFWKLSMNNSWYCHTSKIVHVDFFLSFTLWMQLKVAGNEKREKLDGHFSRAKSWAQTSFSEDCYNMYCIVQGIPTCFVNNWKLFKLIFK